MKINIFLMKRAWFEREVNLREIWNLVILNIAVDPMNVKVNLITENVRAANIFFLVFRESRLSL